MDVIYVGQSIDLNWSIKRNASEVLEDFSRADLKVFLTGNDFDGNYDGKYYFANHIDEQGRVVLDIDAGSLTPGTYCIEGIWIKNSHELLNSGWTRSISRARKDRIFKVSDVESECTDYDEEAGHVVAESHEINIATGTTSYGYDGMSAYETAIFNGSTAKTEKEWIDTYEKAEDRVNYEMDESHDGSVPGEPQSWANAELKRKQAEGQIGDTDPYYSTSRRKKESDRQTAETARATAEDSRQEYEGQGDYSDTTAYPNTRRAKEAARQTAETGRAEAESGRVSAETTRVQNEGSGGPSSTGYSTSRIKNELDRQAAESQRQTNEGIGATDAECAAGSRRKNESIRQANEETRQAQEGTSSDDPSSDGSRWARYKYNEGTNAGSTSGDASRWGKFKEQEGTLASSESGASDRWGQYKEQEGTSASTDDDSRWASYNAAEADRETAYATAEGETSSSSNSDRWGKFNNAQGARETAYNNAEGTAADAGDASGSRWARFNKAQSDRATAYDNAEGEATDNPSASGSRWARFNKAQDDRTTAYNTAETTRNNGMAPLVGIFDCSTAAATAQKEVTASNYVLTNGGAFKIKFTYANSASSPTLKINSETAKAIVFNGAVASASNTWGAGEVVEFYYDPSYNSDAGGYIGRSTVVSVSQNASTGKTTISVGSDSYDVATEPVSVSQNTETGEKELNIGGEKVLVVEKEPQANSKNPVSSGGVFKGLYDVISQIEFLYLSVSEMIANKKVATDGSISNATDIYIKTIPVKKDTLIYLFAIGSSSAGVLSFSVNDGTSTTDTVTVYMTGVGQGWYSMKAPSDGYIYICLSSSSLESAKYLLISDTSVFKGVFAKVTKGSNLLSDYIGSLYSDTAKWGSGFLDSSGNVTSHNSYVYTLEYIPAVQGTYFSRFMMSSSASIVMYDKNKIVIGSLQGGHLINTRERLFPERTAYFRISVSTSFDSAFFAFISQQDAATMDEIVQYVLEHNDDSDDSQELPKIDNNLSTNNPNDDWIIINEAGVTSLSNYGLNNVKYEIPIPEGSTKLHIRYRFKLSRSLFDNGLINRQNIFSINDGEGNIVCRSFLDQRSASYDSNKNIIHRRTLFHTVGWNEDNYVQFENAGAFDELAGPSAYSIKYKGNSEDDLYIVIGTSAVSLVDENDTIIESVSIETDESLDSVIDKINLTNNLEAVAYQTATLKWTDVWASASKIPIRNGNGDIAIYYPRILYNKDWHTFEAIFEPSTYTMACCLDGATTKIIGNSAVVIRSLTIGGDSNVSEYNNTPLILRDLHICFDSFEDAELVDVPNQTTTGTTPQLISNTNPHIIIWEGHGIEVGRDSDTYAQTLVVSTDRLRTVFAELQAKGYKPISYQQLIAWKRNGITIPKRCYTLMFDDFQIENYMVQEKRSPFIEFGVNTGLAILTNHSRNEEVVIDGVTWNLGEVFDAIDLAGWHPCSHTINDTRLGILIPENILPTLKECANSCAKLGIYSDIMVYPYGNTSKDLLYAIPLSAFSLGITVSVDGYICIASNNYLLNRTEIGQRRTLSSVLDCII